MTAICIHVAFLQSKLHDLIRKSHHIVVPSDTLSMVLLIKIFSRYITVENKSIIRSFLNVRSSFRIVVHWPLNSSAAVFHVPNGTSTIFSWHFHLTLFNNELITLVDFPLLWCYSPIYREKTIHVDESKSNFS